MQCGGKNRSGKTGEGTVRRLRDKERERYWARKEIRRGLTCAGSWPSCLRQRQFSARSLPWHGLDACLPVPLSLCPSVRQCARSSQLGHRPSAWGGGGERG